MSDKLYHTWDDMRKDLTALSRQMTLEGFTPGVIAGPGRGGYIPGVMLSHFYNVPFEGFNWQTRDGFVEDSTALLNILSKYNGKNILIIDDINDSGTTLIGIDKIVSESSCFSDVRYATIFEKVTSDFNTDWCAREIESDQQPWIVFPYEEWWR